MCTRKEDPVAYTKAYQAAKYEQMDYRTKLLYAAKARAKKRGIEFELTKEVIILPKRCPLLGVEIDYSIKGHKLLPNSPSIDRIDNTKGYVPGNVWVISYKANSMKNSASLEELKLFARNTLKRFAAKM